jgi:hypothetical protein
MGRAGHLWAGSQPAYHCSKWTIVSKGWRAAGRNSVPRVWATGMSAACITASNGIPSSSAASRSGRRWKVVRTLPSPRARAASMKLQAPGMIDLHREACTTTGAWSVRPSTHGITWTGTWWMWSAR